MSLKEKWEQFQPTKTMLAWACVGSVAATIALGFTVGGWMTGGSAHQMASSAGDEARAELAAAVCVQNFLNSPGYRTQLAELKGIDSSFRQRQFIEGGDWAMMPDRESVNRRAAALCAETLAAWEASETAQDEVIEH